jgi:hypothetical protein
VNTSVSAHVLVASVADRAAELCSAMKSQCSCVWGGGSRRFPHRGMSHVRSPGGPTGVAQCVFRLGRPSSLGWLLEGNIRSNRRGTGPSPGGVGGEGPLGSPYPDQRPSG